MIARRAGWSICSLSWTNRIFQVLCAAIHWRKMWQPYWCSHLKLDLSLIHQQPWWCTTSSKRGQRNCWNGRCCLKLKLIDQAYMCSIIITISKNLPYFSSMFISILESLSSFHVFAFLSIQFTLRNRNKKNTISHNYKLWYKVVLVGQCMGRRDVNTCRMCAIFKSSPGSMSHMNTML